MSSAFDILSNYASDNFTPKIKQIRREIIKEKTKDLRLESESLRSEGRNSHAVVRFNDESLKFATSIPAGVAHSIWELPVEPDGNTLRLWFMLDHLGTYIKDISGFNHNGYLFGHPTLTRTTLNMGFMQTSASPGFPAVVFNSILQEIPTQSGDDIGDPSEIFSSVTGECIVVQNHDDIDFTTSGFNKKFSVCFRFYAFDYSVDATNNGYIFRRFACMRSDANNGWLIAFTDTGNLVFHVYDSSTWYRRRINTLSLNTWYDVVCTYDPAASPRIKIYVNASDTSVDDSGSSFLLPYTTWFHLNIAVNIDTINLTGVGFFRGYIQDFRLYMNRILTGTEVTNLYTNKLTTQNTALGNVAVVNYFTIDPA